MKFEKAFPSEKRLKPAGVLHRLPLPRIKSHAPYQVALTAAALATSVLAFVFAAFLQSKLLQLEENYTGDITNPSLPCARALLPACSATVNDVCQTACCPDGYQCARNPTVGLYCQYRDASCGQFDFCLDVADTPGTCEREPCQDRGAVRMGTAIVYVLAAAGVILDLMDMILCFALADNVLLKSVDNMVSSLVKLLGFGGLIGVGSHEFLTTLYEARCFNAEGNATVGSAYVMFAAAASMLFLSTVFTLVLVPISALHGGRLTDKPMYQLKVLDLGG